MQLSTRTKDKFNKTIIALRLKLVIISVRVKPYLLPCATLPSIASKPPCILREKAPNKIQHRCDSLRIGNTPCKLSLGVRPFQLAIRNFLTVFLFGVERACVVNLTHAERPFISLSDDSSTRGKKAERGGNLHYFSLSYIGSSIPLSRPLKEAPFHNLPMLSDFRLDFPPVGSQNVKMYIYP